MKLWPLRLTGFGVREPRSKFFDGVVNLKVAMNAFQELVDGINAEKAELETMAKAVTAKYSGNRAQRRAKK